MKNGKEKPTRDELINAGNQLTELQNGVQFDVSEEFHLVYWISDGEIALYEKSNGNQVHNFGTRESKEQFNDIYKMFTGKDLDFEAKEKSYAWEDCFGDAGWEIDKYSDIYQIIDLEPCKECKSIFKTIEQAKQAKALAQLSWIIPAINEDYPNKTSIYYCTYIAFWNGEISFGECMKAHKNDYLVVVDSCEGARKLIETNSELLKQALCLTK